MIWFNKSYFPHSGSIALKMHEKCPHTDFFWSVFSCIQSEYRKIQSRKIPHLDTFHDVSSEQNRPKNVKIATS